MAIFLRGMTRAEIARWTAAMIASGERFDFTDLRRDGKPLALVDKHSTGGVGDKITIPLVPVVMACGGAVPQAAGRGLGHTGGTLDKLEAIPGFTAEISKDQIRQQLCDIGAAIFAAGELAPADRKIYALRDVTGTTESLPLIASSVMSKKIAEGADALVLDVKVGSGRVPEDRGRVARAGAHDGRAGRRARACATRALLTDMDVPLGRTVGNAVEVAESLEVLAGGGPADVVELTLALAARDARRGGPRRRRPGADAARRHRRWTASARWSPPRVATCRNRCRSVRTPRPSSAPRGGTMGDIDAMAVGLAVWRLGAGRAAPGEQVQFGAGLRIHRRPGEPVAAGEPLFTLYTDTPERFERRDGRTGRRLDRRRRPPPTSAR